MPANHNVPHTAAAKAKMSKAHMGKPVPWKHRESKVENSIRLWRCGKCGKFFPKVDFYKNKKTLLGIKSTCKHCHNSVSIASRDAENTKRLRRESEARRRARKAKSGGEISSDEMKAIEIAWGDVCLLCGSRDNLQWDHIVPLSKGGIHDISNLQRLCRKCNEMKQARYADYRSDKQKSWVIEFKKI